MIPEAEWQWIAGVIANPDRVERLTQLLALDVASTLLLAGGEADADALPMEALEQLCVIARDVMARLEEHGL